jgi:hypothetical protein
MIRVDNMGKTNKYSEVIWRNYDHGDRNISASAEVVHNYLFQKSDSVSSYNKDDATLLTHFFQELKFLSTNQEKNLGDILK